MSTKALIWLRALLRRSRVQDEIDEELAYHISMRAREYQSQGMKPHEARRAALRRFGDLDTTRVQCHRLFMVEPTEQGDGIMSQLMQDIRFGFRTISGNPGFTFVVVLTLAQGIGANSAIFSIIDGVLLRPFPYEQPDRLVMVWENDRLRGTVQEWLSGPDFFDLVERNQVFDALAAFMPLTYTFTDRNAEPQLLSGVRVSHNLFSLLGVSPLIGRPLRSDDDRPGGARVVVLSHRFWMGRFGGERGVVDRSMDLEGESYRIVGVMPAGFEFPSAQTDFWTPLQITPTSVPRGNHSFRVVGRLKPGVGLDQVNSNLAAIASALEEEYRDDNLGRGMWADSLYASVVGDVQSPLLILFGAVGVVLLIACVNVANLLFARSAAREHEVSVRVAMGAGRGALIRQFLIESLMLALLGGAAGLALAFWGARALVAMSPSSLPRLGNVALDTRVLGFTLLISVVTGVIFGLLPAITASKPDLLSPLKEGGRGATSRKKRRLRRLLVVSELAMAVVLLVSAGLLMKSFRRLLQVDPGFSATNVITVGVQLPASRYPQEFSTFPNWTKVRGFQQELIRQVQAIPGVDRAALAYNNPTEAGWTTRFTIEGRPAVEAGEQEEVRIRPVSAEYFRTVGIPILKGRPLEERDDRTDAPPVILVNEAFVRRYFQDEDPIGARVSLWNVSREIVGIVEDVKFQGLDQDVPPALYTTFSQMPFTGFSLLVRTSRDSDDMLARIRDAIWSLDRDLALSDFSTLAQLLSRTTAQPRFNMILLGLFAAVAIVLAAVGIYGVMSYGVNQRTREIGVRLSVGARKVDVIRQVLAEGFKLSGLGILIGVAGAFAATRALESFLFGVGTLDPATFALVCVLSALVGIAASFIPAMRASRVDPVVALRYE